MYEHADQSWRKQPKLMSNATRIRVAERIGEYARDEDLKHIAVVFHGGEPLLAGASRITETARWIREHLPPTSKVDFSIQTNGTLLDQNTLADLAAADICVAISIDGHRAANDLHRLDHRGRSSFEKTERALNLLEKHPNVYSGIIAVIDPMVSPEDLFDFFAPRRPPRLDFLLPDANHVRLPPGRVIDENLYTNWLLKAFDVWFDEYPHIPVRTFDAILNGVAGIASDTDAFGLGDVSLIMLETDGSYHDVDVLKITVDGATALRLDVESNSIAEAALSPVLAAHRFALRREGLSEKCQRCPELEICGGGAVPHRFSASGFLNPTVYCKEMLALIGHARRRVESVLYDDGSDAQSILDPARTSITSLGLWERPEESGAIILELLGTWSKDASPKFEKVLDHIAQEHSTLSQYVEKIRSVSRDTLERLAIQPSVVMWTEVVIQSMRNVLVHAIDGQLIIPDFAYVATIAAQLERWPERYPRVHRDDQWLRLPFGNRIYFEHQESAHDGANLVDEAFAIIEMWRPALATEIRTLNADIQFVRDLSAHPDKAVSFSDNSTPGALYISVRVSGRNIDPYLLADSIIHEHRHQKLYLLQREIRLFQADAPLVHSPWREDPRPPSGLLHAVFVFVHLYEYWSYIAESSLSLQVRERAAIELDVIAERIEAAIPTLRGTRLTQRGVELVDHLVSVFQLTACSPT